MITFEEIVLVDENDQQTGIMEKIEAHKKGLLHRAFSVFILNSSGQLLLQKRAAGKYHSPGLWTNTCCSHPRPGETVMKAAVRRLKEEMGISCSLKESFTFIYRSEFDNGLTEHELDHVIVGISDNVPLPDPNEVDDFKYVDLLNLKEYIDNNPEQYSVWLIKAYPKVHDILKQLVNQSER